jgi:hypothetical protein
VDPANALLESNEGNNESQSNVEVARSGQLWDHAMQVFDGRTIYHLRVMNPGEIRVRAQWTGTQSTLWLIINGPGQVGYYARQDGASPLEVSYYVTESDLAAGDDWRVSIVAGSGPASGTIQISYPSGSTVAPYSTEFVVQSGYASAVSLIVLQGTGTLGAQTSWSGSPSNMALIINGPGQVGYYAREDGPSPLSASYEVTVGDLSAGDTWRISLTSFNPADAEGTVRLIYP